jgi:hypothetical protein
MGRQPKQLSNYSPSTIRELLLPFFASLVLYGLTISDNLSVSSDSIDYINTMDSSFASGRPLFHPHHLLNQPAGVLWLEFLRSIGITSDSARIVPLLPALVGSLTLCVFYLILRNRLGLSRALSLIGTALPAFSFAFWYYSDCVDVYNFPLLFIMLSLYLVTADRLGPMQCVLVGFTTAMAVIFHQIHVLFIPVALAAFFIRRYGSVSFWRRTAGYLAGLVPSVALPYLLVIFAVKRLTTFDEITGWVTRYGHHSAYWYPPALSTLFKAFVGFFRSIIGTHFAMAIPSLKSFSERVFAGKWLTDEYYLVHNMDPRLALILLGLSILIALMCLLFVILRLRYFRAAWNGTRTVVPLAVICFAIYGAFFFFFEPHNFKFWIMQSLCWWLFFIALFTFSETSKPRGEISRARGLSVIAILILFVNYFGSVAFLASRTNDYYYRQIAPLSEFSDSGDLVIADRSWVVGNYLERFTDVNVLCLSDACEESEDSDAYILKVRDAITQTLERGDRVFILGDAVEPGSQAVYNYGERMTDIVELWNLYRDQWQQMELELTTLYILEPENWEES